MQSTYIMQNEMYPENETKADSEYERKQKDDITDFTKPNELRLNRVWRTLNYTPINILIDNSNECFCISLEILKKYIFFV